MLKRALFGAVLSAAVAVPALADEVEVKMLNKGANGDAMVFEPALIKIKPGDSVRFVPTDKPHNAQVVPKMLPEGAEAFEGGMNEEITVTFDQEGVYGVKCLPHYGMGMVALVAVGESYPNLEDAKAVRHMGRGKQRFEALFEELEAGTSS
ncbi:pseudoazurin [Marinivivus vitaminiproducens]|uniref:pseudoazurin n=1 Tax=Marinivivus vitaminiproducens TaxID=3035935 RepID=UPI0027A75F51|nr:pseudoazurin [Geminicoccaceae bacterium SCSIO 64248]